MSKVKSFVDRRVNPKMWTYHVTADRSGFANRCRGFHPRHGGSDSREASVTEPVHVISFRAFVGEPVIMVRVLHQCMEAVYHLGISL